jgi:hypothetical protein
LCGTAISSTVKSIGATATTSEARVATEHASVNIEDSIVENGAAIPRAAPTRRPGTIIATIDQDSFGAKATTNKVL